MTFQTIVAVASLLAGFIAALAGFGIGSLLTPLLSFELGVKLAVAAASIPHFIATALRCWTLRARIDRKVLSTFGVMSAAGALVGALLHAHAENTLLRVAFGLVLVFIGLGGMFHLTERMRFGRRTAWIAGAVSGALGGLVGSQGSIRAAAMLGFDVAPEAFVATATAIALLVDVVRMPVYFVTEGAGLLGVWPIVTIAVIGTVTGTLLARNILRHVNEKTFRQIVSLLIFLLGVATLIPRHAR